MNEPRERWTPHLLGAWGEDLAVRTLVDRGWTIVERGYRFGRREIDVIARRGEVLAFVEVKTRAGHGYGPPEEAVTRRKRSEIEAVARHYMRVHRPGDVEVRFDVVAIVTGRGRVLERLHHIEDAWRPES